MAKAAKVIIIRTAGTNCDQETAFAFRSCGAEVDMVHINELSLPAGQAGAGKKRLKDYHILVIPGGFSYGDDIASGRILANELILRVGESIYEFIQAKKLIIGICNGFQVLVKCGILPGPLSAENICAKKIVQNVTLSHNDSSKFEDRWVHLKVEGDSVWTEGVGPSIFIPVAHGEGKFITVDAPTLQQLEDNGQVAFRYRAADGSDPQYPQNPNGSQNHIAGITDRSGRILGLMPHPERHFLFTQHPYWTRLPKKDNGDGAKIFENGVNYVKKHF